MGIDLTKYRSHPTKYLHQHLKDVVAGSCKRTNGKLSLLIELSAIFHDLGKINPNFQIKLDNRSHKEYSQHAYLSAITWLYFYHENKSLFQKWKLDESEVLGLACIIAHHHGNLPNLGTNVSRIFKNSGTANPTKLLTDFLQSKSDGDIPISQYLEVAELLPDKVKHKSFSLIGLDDDIREEYLDSNLYGLIFENPINLYQTLQFTFASLIESDKRDASENKNYQGEIMAVDFPQQLSTNLQSHLTEIEKDANKKDNPKKKKLDAQRSKMREEAILNLCEFLKLNDRRVFSLPAPTGAGKTLMLLSLANELLKHRSDLSIIYALPFLAITEQTANIAHNILKDEQKVLRVDSKAENKSITKLQEELDNNPNDETVKELLQQLFSHETFDHPFIITTFVQLFETLISNRNATLLRLPNFSKTVFLIDEIQALPPSLYTFFVAYLDKFCRLFDSYAIVSTATMPHLKLPDEKNYTNEIQKPSNVFQDYQPPCELLTYDYYDLDEFNRYKIIPQFGVITNVHELAERIQNQNESCLVVLNTIKDTKNLFAILNPDAFEQTEEGQYILLNTHFSLEDRQEKLKICNERLEKNEKVVLISTQLIEAGVDIDFPVVYRDLCPLPNLIQTAGRCNRNYRINFGTVHFFELKESGKKSSAYKIYGRDFDWFLSFTKQEINRELYERELLPIQQTFAEDKVNNALQFGKFKAIDGEYNAVECISQIRFEDLGKLKIIDEEYGFELRVYVKHDAAFEKLLELRSKGRSIPPRDFQAIRLHRQEVERQLRITGKNLVTVRLPSKEAIEKVKRSLCDTDEVFGIYQIASESYYSAVTGLQIEFEGGEII